MHIGVKTPFHSFSHYLLSFLITSSLLLAVKSSYLSSADLSRLYFPVNNVANEGLVKESFTTSPGNFGFCFLAMALKMHSTPEVHASI